MKIKTIPGLEGLYSVTTDGKVWSHKLKGGKFLKLYTSKLGYKSVAIHSNGKQRTSLVHRLVALTYIPNIENKPQINHKNGIRDDNRLENLEWCTNKENTIHGFVVNGRKVSEKQREASRMNGLKGAKPIMQLTKEGILCKIYKSTLEAQKILGIANSNISACALGKVKTAGGYGWKYI